MAIPSGRPFPHKSAHSQSASAVPPAAGCRFQQARRERRVQKHDIERLRRALQEMHRITLMHLRSGRPPLSQVRAQLPDGNCILLNESHLARATGESFEAQRSTTGKQVEQCAPATRGASQLNNVSRTRSGVGRMSARAGKRRRRPRHVPPMILNTREPAPGLPPF